MDAQNKKQEDTPFLSLDKKRVMFIGNSFVYYGNCVTYGSRDNDKGYFYQLARSNGEDVYVYNYTYGGKNLRYIYENHLSRESADFLALFDIVFISEAGENNANILGDIKKITALFPKSTRFCYLCHEYTHFSHHTHILSSLGKMEESGIEVADWGGLVYDLWNSDAFVPDSDTYYIRQTFIKDNKGGFNGEGAVASGKPGDCHHQNPLSGYLCALMAYCTVSGRQAYGAEYSFCTDKSLHPFFDTEAFVAAHYNNGVGTNMNEIFSSEKEMRGLQRLVDSLPKKSN